MDRRVIGSLLAVAVQFWLVGVQLWLLRRIANAAKRIETARADFERIGKGQ